MAKNYQLFHLIGKAKHSTRIYAASTTPGDSTTLATNGIGGGIDGATSFASLSSARYSSKGLFTIRITDIDELTDWHLILNEITMTKSLRHVNLMPLLNCLVSESQVWLVYPFMYYGSCRDILDCIDTLNDNDDAADDIATSANNNVNGNNNNNNNNNGQESRRQHSHVDLCDEQKRLCFNEQSLQIISKCVLSALVYLHNKHIVHRCVCPDNIYISQSGHVLLSGLRHSASLIEQGTLLKSRHDYSPHFADHLIYLSPEILKQNLAGYSTKSDIYSLGVTLCELANGINPFFGCENAQMLYEKLLGCDIGLWDRNILTSEVCVNENPQVVGSIQRRHYSERFRNFVDVCVERTSELRPSALQLAEHAFIRKYKQSHSIQSIFQMSVMAEGLVERQRKQRAQQAGRQGRAQPPPQPQSSASLASQQQQQQQTPNNRHQVTNSAASAPQHPLSPHSVSDKSASSASSVDPAVAANFEWNFDI